MRNLYRRRQILLGSLLSLLPPLACTCSVHAQHESGCWINEADAETFLRAHQTGQSIVEDHLVSSSGVSGLEDVLLLTLDDLSNIFGILPAFSFYKEETTPNAKAFNVDITNNNRDGTIIFGIDLLNELLQIPLHPDAAIVAVCAHEFAHIYSYSSNFTERLRPPGASPFMSEQFADYMAGYYAGRRKLRNRDFPAVVFAEATSKYGGGSHGTSEQRATAVEEGFKAAFYGGLQTTKAGQQALDFVLAQG